MKYKILFLALITSIFSFGQISENIQSWTNRTAYGSYTQLITAGTVNMTQCIVSNAALATGTCSAGRVQMNTSNGIIELPTLPSVGTVEVRLAAGAAGRTVKLQYFDGSVWQDLTTFTGISTTGATYSYVMNVSTATTLRLSSSNNPVYVHDINVTLNSGPVPTITLTPTSLSGFAYVVGSGPSAEQSFTVSGTNLTTNVVLTAPTNYQISTTSGSGFVNSVSLPFGSGTLASTTIYVRLNSGLSVNSYTGNITADSTGAAQKTVALSGNVTGSTQSDIVAVAGSEAATISSTINNAAPLTAATGNQVWQIKGRDGGATLNDSDNLPTVLTAFTIAQFANTATTWSNAINTIALFDGSTFIASGTVTANQIQFTGLNVSVADNTEKTLSLRLSLKCPLGVGIFDNDRFGFSISNANTTFSPTGSGKVAFSAIQNTSGTNLIQVVGTQLSFLVQPITTGVNGPMSPAVKVRTLDACGNFDSNFTGTISITSTGTLAFSPVSAVAVNGVATFSSLTHTVSGTGYVLNATSSGLTGATSTTFNIDNVTVLQPGDIAILAFNTGIATGEDEISFVTLVDMLPGTRIDITDNAYQKCGTPNGWGISEGWIRLERANTVLPKGTIVTVRIDGTGLPSVFSPDPTNWIYSKPQPASQGTFNLNNFGEQIFFMSGGNVGGPNATTASSDAGIYSGNFLFGFNTKGNVWTPVCGNSAAGGTQNSDKPINFDCFLTWPTAQADLNKYTGLMTPATKRDWIERINNPSNWTGYVDNTAYDAGPNFYGQSITINAGGFTDGIWIGSSSNNWFECGNWQSLKVPDENVNVILDSNSVQKVKIDSTAPFSDLYADIAKCRNLSVSNFSVELLSDINNVLYVYGDLSISGVGSINMNDGNNSSNDGIIKLFGNWTNNVGLSAFDEGNGTVEFLSGTTQVINNNVHTNTEEFYNVVLDNNFNTFLSNNLIAKGNLEVKANRVFTIATNDYAFAYKKLTNNGSISIGNNGQFIQVDEIDTNDGNYSGTKFQVNRTAQAKNFDYVYWSAPTESFPISSLPTNNRYEWSTLFPNTNGTFGNWILPSTATMTKGQGYIARASNGAVVPTALATTFVGKPNNGQFTLQIYRGNYTGPDYDADLVNPTNLWTTAYDDNWNLLGNPYPSAIDAMEFINLNTASNNVKMVGAIWVWKHG
ncbi:MAG: hypothetical protein K2P85_11755, partial [Flavobacteriaceae bacterium]|nr:hypothetical protein [Flavobacteriaceae bacterium]